MAEGCKTKLRACLRGARTAKSRGKCLGQFSRCRSKGGGLGRAQRRKGRRKRKR